MGRFVITSSIPIANVARLVPELAPLVSEGSNPSESVIETFVPLPPPLHAGGLALRDRQTPASRMNSIPRTANGRWATRQSIAILADVP
jgi:hypothetical protein